MSIRGGEQWVTIVMDLEQPMAKQKKKTTARKSKVASSGQRKVTRRKRKTSHPTFSKETVLDTDQVYRAINKVQLTREVVEFCVKESDSAVIQNIIKDLALPHERTDHGEVISFKISPAPETSFEQAFEDLDEFPDEIVEDGQVF